MRGVDHDPLGLAAIVRQRCENVERTQTAPANEPIVDRLVRVIHRLVRVILCRRVAPAKPILDHKHNRAHDSAVVNPGDTAQSDSKNKSVHR